MNAEIPVSNISIERLVHRLSSPLGALCLWVQELGGDCDTDRKQELVGQLVGEVKSLSHMLKTAAFVDQGERVRWSEVHLQAVLEQAIASTIVELPTRPPPTFATTSSQPIWIGGDAPLLAQMFEQIIKNAMESGASQVRISSNITNETVLIDIDDDGEGIMFDEEIRIWEPFVSTKPGHFGLGLPLAARIAQIHYAKVLIQPRQPVGARATVCLPLAHSNPY